MTNLTLAIRTARGIMVVKGAFLKVKKRTQHPAVQEATDVREPYWFARIFEHVLGENGQMKEVRKKYNLGPSAGPDKITKRQAEEKRDQIVADVGKAAQELKTVSGSITMLQAVQLFREGYMPTIGPVTRINYEWVFRKVLLPRWGNVKLAAIKTHDIQVWMNGLAYLASGTRNNYRNTMSGVIEYVSTAGFFDLRNPCKGVSIPAGEGVREKRLPTPDVIRRIEEDLPTPLHGIILRSAAVTGLRVSEALGLKWENVDLETGFIELKQRWSRRTIGKLKTQGSKRRACFPANELAVIRELHKARRSEWVFANPCNPAEPFPYETMKKAIRTSAERLGVRFPGFGMHTMRRAYITLAQQEGEATPLEVSKFVGHSSLDTTLIYTKPYDERLSKVNETVSKRLAFRNGGAAA